MNSYWPLLAAGPAKNPYQETKPSIFHPRDRVAHPNLYKLEQSKAKTYSGGMLRGASEHEFRILTGQGASMYSVRLTEGGVREPHWHPSGWEFDYCLAGRAQMTVLDPKGHRDSFEVEPGDAIFIPQGHYHYFENIGAGELHFLLVFNTSLGESQDDIGVAGSIAVLPNDVLAALFGVSEEVFRRFPKRTEPLVLVNKKLKT